MENGVQSSCACGGANRSDAAPAWFRRGPAERRRDTCCESCGSGVLELSDAEFYPAGAGYYPQGGDAASDAAARERAAREAADRQAALNAFTGLTGAVQSGVTAGQETERVRLQTEAQTAQARAQAQAELERARIEAQRDIELARLRGAQPNVSLAPLESTTPSTTPSSSTPVSAAPTVSQRTDSGAGSFPVGKAVVVVGLAGLAIWAFKSSGGKRRGKRG